MSNMSSSQMSIANSEVTVWKFLMFKLYVPRISHPEPVSLSDQNKGFRVTQFVKFIIVQRGLAHIGSIHFTIPTECNAVKRHEH